VDATVFNGESLPLINSFGVLDLFPRYDRIVELESVNKQIAKVFLEIKVLRTPVFLHSSLLAKVLGFAPASDMK
jgi:hypothetical protein